MLTAEEAAARARALIAQGGGWGSCSGPSGRGSRTRLLLADAIVSIPTSPRFASLNLGQAVLVCAYEVHRSGQATETADVPAARGDTATKAEVAGLVEHLVASWTRSTSSARRTGAKA